MPRENMSKFRSAMGVLRRQFVKVFVFSLFLNLTILVVPLYMLQVYDRVLSSQSTDTLFFLTALAGSLLIAMALVEMARSWLLVQSATWLDNALSSVLFKLTLAHRLQGEDISVSQPMRDLEVVRSFLTGPGLPALFDSPWVPFYLAIIFFMHPIFGMIAVFGALVILTLAILSDIATKNATRQSSSAHMISNSFLDSLARNADAIHSMGMVNSLNKLWLRTHDAGVAWQEVAGDRAGVLNSIAKAFRMSLQIAILGSGAWLAIQQIITPGVMIAASIIMSRALAPAEAAISNWRNFISARQAHLRLKTLLGDTTGDDSDQTQLPPPTGRLQVDKVFMRHTGDKGWLLQNLTFQLDLGETLGVIGPSGIGKSSLIRLLIGLSKPNLGTVRVDGVEICNWSFEVVGPHIGYVPQDVELLIGTVADNIRRFTDATESKDVVTAAKLAGAHEIILRLPNGYDTVLGEGGSKVSGGQRQRIALARALFGNPNYIIMDEPNANLDQDGQHALQQTLKSLKQLGKTVIIVSHHASVLSLADKLLVLSHGNKYIFGPRNSVFQQLKAQAQGTQTPPAKAKTA